MPFRGLRGQRPASGEALAVERRRAGRSRPGAASATSAGAPSDAKKSLIVELVERDQRAPPARDILAWPVSERCLARDSSSRAPAVWASDGGGAGDRGARRRDRIRNGRIHVVNRYTSPADRFMTVRGLIVRLDRSRKTSTSCSPTAFRAAALTRFMGWFSKIEQPAGPRPVDRLLAAVLRPRSARSAKDAASRACTTASRAS